MMHATIAIEIIVLVFMSCLLRLLVGLGPYKGLYSIYIYLNARAGKKIIVHYLISFPLKRDTLQPESGIFYKKTIRLDPGARWNGRDFSGQCINFFTVHIIPATLRHHAGMKQDKAHEYI